MNDKKNNLEELRAVTKALNKNIKAKSNNNLAENDTWRLVFDRIPTPMCLAGNDTYFKEVNIYFCELLGFSRDELLDKPYTEFVHPDDVEGTYAVAGKIGAKKCDTEFSNRYKTKTGEYIRLKWHSAIYSDNMVIAVAIPVTN